MLVTALEYAPSRDYIISLALPNFKLRRRGVEINAVFHI